MRAGSSICQLRRLGKWMCVWMSNEVVCKMREKELRGTSVFPMSHGMLEGSARFILKQLIQTQIHQYNNESSEDQKNQTKMIRTTFVNTVNWNFLSKKSKSIISSTIHSLWVKIYRF